MIQSCLGCGHGRGAGVEQLIVAFDEDGERQDARRMTPDDLAGETLEQAMQGISQSGRLAGRAVLWAYVIDSGQRHGPVVTSTYGVVRGDIVRLAVMFNAKRYPSVPKAPPAPDSTP